MVAIISKIDNANCVVTKDFLSQLSFPALIIFLNTSVDLNRDRNIAGYKPAIKLTRISNASRALITLALNNKFTVIVLPAKLLNAGKTIITIINASTNENKQKKKDSLKNFLMSNDCPAPNTFCIPVSLARFNAAA